MCERNESLFEYIFSVPKFVCIKYTKTFISTPYRMPPFWGIVHSMTKSDFILNWENNVYP